MNLRLCSLALLGLASAGLLRADLYKESFNEVRPLNPGGTIEVDNTNGSITIRTWDRNEVRIAGEKGASDPDILKSLHVEIDSTPDSIAIRAKQDEHWLGFFHWHRQEGIRFDLMVPAGAQLKSVGTVNGQVDIAGVAGPVRIGSVNGAVHVAGLRGGAHISTVNGAIHAEFAAVAARDSLSFSTVNGAITILLPRSAAVQVRTSTVNGHVTCDFPSTADAAAVAVSAHTVNGAVTVKAAPDKT